MRHSLAALALVALCVSPVLAQENLGFQTESEQWFEFSVSGGWGIYQSAANQYNINGGTRYLFDDGTGNGGSLRAEVRWAQTENFMLGFGIWYSRGTDDAVSSEVTDPQFEPAPSDQFLYYRSVTHHLAAPYVSARYFFNEAGRTRYFLSGGMLLGISRATLSYNTEGLASGELSGEHHMGDTKGGLMASVGLRRLATSTISFGAEVGYRYVEKMLLDQGQSYLVTPPLGPVALAVSNILDVNYSGPFAMFTITLRP